ncbi:UDP-glucose 4-epimerase GalE [Anoxybacter fermentans]|uniref:UDP-glucose 4-epimerase n=1 Tax=Anoxybacter fermentans TaxID=1323375 RepID=A0A3Q9HRV0_9FIRM|nr:UDP-glucose 4-epimerase GalE [Anoxybacter fermentans]AZR73920.1 UDP-glucose 4-epimerase GalE [Anoxybacter fermentans]
MNVLITGGAGYIGSHVVLELSKTNHNIIVYDNLQKGHRGAVLAGKLIVGDLNDTDKLEHVCREYDIQGVMHFAADSLVGESMKDPAKYYKNNVGNAINLLEVMRKNGIKYMVFSSTAAVYGEPDRIPITEETLTNPTNVYGRTKLVIEEMLKDYDRAYGMKFITLRYFNASGADPSGQIGEDHSPETHLIPLVLYTALGKRESISIFGTDYPTRDGTCIRDYIHVSDLAQAHILALEALLAGSESKIYNLGNGEGYSVREVIDMVKKVTGRDFKVNESERRPGDPAILVASSAKARKELGWKPQYGDLQKIIETAWNWHKNNPDGFK